MNRNDAVWMERCLDLAAKGAGAVSPNPMVGAVIVKGGRKLGEGFHRRFGGPHAEIEAITDALSRGHDLHGTTIYVNLEPCSHHGKTPPCTDALIAHGFAAVVIGTKDPNPKVSGRGLRALQKAGIECRIGVLEQEALRLNAAFLHYIRHRMPWVTLKAAQTADGFIARSDGSSRWISSRRSRTLVHRLRSHYDAVLVGAGTVSADDPQLTVRLVKGKNPLRVVVDGRFSVSAGSRIFNEEAKTIVYTREHFVARQSEKVRQLKRRHVEIVALPGNASRLPVRAIMKDLGRRGIASVLVEGGATVFSEFLNARCVNDRILFTAPTKFGEGLRTFGGPVVSYRTQRIREQQCGSDEMVHDLVLFEKGHQ